MLTSVCYLVLRWLFEFVALRAVERVSRNSKSSCCGTNSRSSAQDPPPADHRH